MPIAPAKRKRKPKKPDMNIPENQYLGRLCRRGHDYEGTGKSLRNKNKLCVECVRIKSRVDHQKRKGAVWYKKSKRESDKRYKSTERGALVTKCLSRKRDARDRSELGTAYIKRILIQKTPLKFKNIPQELVELKRASLLLNRTIREIENAK